jgi:hypothetical protein
MNSVISEIPSWSEEKFNKYLKQINLEKSPEKQYYYLLSLKNNIEEEKGKFVETLVLNKNINRLQKQLLQKNILTYDNYLKVIEQITSKIPQIQTRKSTMKQSKPSIIEDVDKFWEKRVMIDKFGNEVPYFYNPKTTESIFIPLQEKQKIPRMTRSNWIKTYDSETGQYRLQHKETGEIRLEHI